jgi:hypothetical protein
MEYNNLSVRISANHVNGRILFVERMFFFVGEIWGVSLVALQEGFQLINCLSILKNPTG